MSKVVEMLVCRQLMAFFDDHGLLPVHQSAHRRWHSTKIAILKIVSDLLLACDRVQVTLLALLDMSAAFDTVDHVILLDRSQCAFGIRGGVFDWIKSFITNRSQTVSFTGGRSAVSPVVCGVFQGSVLVPFSFCSTVLTSRILLRATALSLTPMQMIFSCMFAARLRTVQQKRDD